MKTNWKFIIMEKISIKKKNQLLIKHIKTALSLRSLWRALNPNIVLLTQTNFDMLSLVS